MARKARNPFRTRSRSSTLGARTPSGVRSLDTTSEALDDIAYRICGADRYKIAKQFLALKQTYPQMTLPEGVVFILLKALQIDFVYQVDAYGGRLWRGGQVPDFMIPSLGLVIRVMGDYWHSQQLQMQRDQADKIRLLGSTLAGQRVSAVVDVWESRVLDCDRENVLRMAINGIELGR